MARVSRDSAPEVVDYGPAEDRTGHFDGYTVNFTSIREDFDLAPVLKGLPGDRPTTELCAPGWRLQTRRLQPAPPPAMPGSCPEPPNRQPQTQSPSNARKHRLPQIGEAIRPGEPSRQH